MDRKEISLMQLFSRALIMSASSKFNFIKAALHIGITRNTLRTKMRQYGYRKNETCAGPMIGDLDVICKELGLRRVIMNPLKGEDRLSPLSIPLGANLWLWNHVSHAHKMDVLALSADKPIWTSSGWTPYSDCHCMPVALARVLGLWTNEWDFLPPEQRIRFSG